MYPNTLNGLAQMGPRQMQPPMGPQQGHTGPMPPHMQPMGQPRPANQMGGMMQGYLASGGPAIGSDPWKAQRAEGNHPFMDYFRQNRPQWQGGQSQMGQNMQPWNQPRPMQSSYGGYR